MDYKVLLAYRAGQLFAQGKTVKQALTQAYEEEMTLQNWYNSVVRTNALLDSFIVQLAKEKRESNNGGSK